MRRREAAARLRSLGCEEIASRSPGSHREWRNPANGKGAALSDWETKDLKPRTLKASVLNRALNENFPYFLDTRPYSNSSRSFHFCILPVRVLGSASAKSTRSGAL